MAKLVVVLLSLAFLALTISSIALPARAWKPNTHLQTGNDAIAEILNGSNTVTIDGTQYQANATVADAIRSFPDYYRGGVVGPDGFPDIYVGQELIHPDNKCSMGLDTSCPGPSSPQCTALGGPCLTIIGPRGAFSHEWLRHVYDSAWDYYTECVAGTLSVCSSGNTDPGKQALAFAYGYLTHAAGDMWGHTLINQFAGATFEDGLRPAINHVIVEAYIGEHTPDTERAISAPSDFIFRTFIDDGNVTGDTAFVDTAGQTSISLGRGAIFEYFSNLAGQLAAKHTALSDLISSAPYGCPVLSPYCAGLRLERIYFEDWQGLVQSGLQAWPDMSLAIAQDLFGQTMKVDPQTGQVTPNWDDASSVVHDFFLRHIVGMIAGPIVNATGNILADISNFVSFITDSLCGTGTFCDMVLQKINQFQNWLIEMTTGIDLEALKDFISHPANFINGGDLTLSSGTIIHVGLPTDTSAKLDSLMCITDGVNNPTEKFSPDCFAADHDTVVMAKLLLLNPDQLNQLLMNHEVGPIYNSSSSFDEGNAMLGFIRSLDGSEQWRQNSTQPGLALSGSSFGRSFSEGMPLWRDCDARTKVFRVIFRDWMPPYNTTNTTPNFPNAGDQCVIGISRTPPPRSVLTVNGPVFNNGAGKLFVSGSTTFTLTSAQPDPFWSPSRTRLSYNVTFDGQTPGPVTSFLASSGPRTIGPLSGLDGDYFISFHATGLRDSPGTNTVVEPGNTIRFTLDTTPPIVTGTISRAPDSNGWYDHPVTITWSGSDSGSGLASCDSPRIYSGPDHGFIQIIGHCTDKVGNVGTAIIVIDYDSTPPVISSPQQGHVFILRQVISTSFTCTDATSGIATCIGSMALLDTSTVGSHSYTVTSMDIAGNMATLVVNYSVHYDFKGIFLPASTTFEKGRTILVRFQLLDALGNPVPNIPARIWIDSLNNPGTSTGTANTGNLFRNSAGGMYAFNLDTLNLTAGLHTIYVTLDDGTVRSITFTLVP